MALQSSREPKPKNKAAQKTEYSVALEPPGADDLSISADYDLSRSRCDVGGQRLVATWYVMGVASYVPLSKRFACSVAAAGSLYVNLPCFVSP